MYTPAFTISPGLLTNVEHIGRILGFLQAVQLPGIYARELLATVEAEIVHASTAIEGNTLTQEQVTQVLAGLPVQALRRDIQEVKNYQATLVYIHAIADHTTAFTHQTILELHYRLLQGVDNTLAGRYRTGFVRVGEYLPPDPFLVHPLMDDLLAWMNTPTPAGYSHLLYAGIVHYQFVAIHPFADGNGRTARALTTLYLLRNGYDITRSFALETHYNRDRAAYYAALHAADTATGPSGERDLTPWLEYFVAALLVEARGAESRIRTYLAATDAQTATRLTATRLTATQRAILQAAAERGVVSSAELAPLLGLSPRGVRKALSQLVALGLLVRQGEKRGAVYRPSAAER